MSDYRDELTAHRAAELANRKARREAEQDARDRRASLEAARAQVRAAFGRAEPAKPKPKPRDEWTTTERQVFAARGVVPTIEPKD
jgi:hypothetical protein